MEDCRAVPPKIKHKTVIWSNNSTSSYKPQRTESRNWNRYLYTNVHSNIIHNSQKVETSQKGIVGWLTKQKVVYTYKVMLFSLKKEFDSDTRYNIDELWRHYAKWNKPDTKGQVLYLE